MNIIILANHDLASNVALNHLLPGLTNHHVSIFLSSSIGTNTNKPEALKQLQYLEQEQFTQQIAPALLAPHKRDSNFMSFTQFRDLLDIPVESLNNINTPEGLAIISACKPDLIISIRYGVILKDAVLKVPVHGVLNLHSGLLPDYRGVMATFWAMLNDESTIGTTLHTIADSSIDTGEIIARSSLPVDSRKSYLWHVLYLYVEGCKLITKAVEDITNRRPLSTTPQSAGGQYFTFPLTNELDAFSQKGLMLVNEEELKTFYSKFYY